MVCKSRAVTWETCGRYSKERFVAWIKEPGRALGMDEHLPRRQHMHKRVKVVEVETRRASCANIARCGVGDLPGVLNTTTKPLFCRVSICPRNNEDLATRKGHAGRIPASFLHVWQATPKFSD